MLYFGDCMIYLPNMLRHLKLDLSLNNLGENTQ